MKKFQDQLAKEKVLREHLKQKIIHLNKIREKKAKYIEKLSKKNL